ncbi:MAG: hydroxyacylglutathione hydrolase [Bdellovibrionales bacterium]|nr:hydroxyacylglutathione hydrolase [Bdellovibrionales bacterium]
MSLEIFTHSWKTFEVLQIPAFDDNYLYLIVDSGSAWAVDPGDGPIIDSVLTQKNLKLKGILNTHHHSDHVGGNAFLAEKWQCPVYAHPKDQARIPAFTHPVQEGLTLELGNLKVQVLDVPGHTLNHVAYGLAEPQWLFCGDTLFPCGCGRLFEGTPQQMYGSLKKLRQLPGETLVFCAHEYTLSNLRFALQEFPDDTLLKRLQMEMTEKKQRTSCTIPTTLQMEKDANPFLRWDDPKIRKALEMSDAEDWQVFAEIRKRRDHF